MSILHKYGLYTYITKYQYEMDFRKHCRLRDGSIKWCKLGNGSIDKFFPKVIHYY